jgi:hydroxyacyl-ACP dehydratase HTD2-like protein with hotdog domain
MPVNPTPDYEDVAIGFELPIMRKGPLTTAHLMRWSSSVENWHKIHYDRTFAIEHDKLPDLLVNGSLKQQFLCQFLKDWAGRRGWLWKISYQVRAMDVVGESLTIWGRVTAKREAPAYGLVDLDIGITNRAGKESTPGKATVALPYHGREAVPYPFVPPSP